MSFFAKKLHFCYVYEACIYNDKNAKEMLAMKGYNALDKDMQAIYGNGM